MESLTSTAIWAIQTMIVMGLLSGLVCKTRNFVTILDDEGVQIDLLSIQHFMDPE